MFSLYYVKVSFSYKFWKSPVHKIAKLEYDEIGIFDTFNIIAIFDGKISSNWYSLYERKEIFEVLGLREISESDMRHEK